MQVGQCLGQEIEGTPCKDDSMNRLANATSPYQHADNPVDWYPTVPDALPSDLRSPR